MYLFYRNQNVELFNVLQIIRIQSENGEGIQSLIKTISEKKYRIISKKFKQIIDNINSGMEFEVAVDKMIQHENNKYLHNLMSSFKLAYQGNIELSQSINEIEIQILNEQKIDFDNYILHVGKYSAFIMYMLLVPFLYLILVIVNWVVLDFMETDVEILDAAGRQGLFIFNSFMLFGAIILMRFRKK